MLLFEIFDQTIVCGTQGADLKLQRVPTYDDRDWVGRTHRGISMRKVASSFKYKEAKSHLCLVIKKKIYIHIYIST